MSKFDVTAIGEIMLRMSVSAGQRLETAASLDVIPGGAESNVLAALARLERDCGFFTALPDNPLGRLAANHLRMAGVNLSGVSWHPSGRIGMYYVEFSTPPRPIQVTYDRADSCAARMTLQDLNWDDLLDTRLLHITGITPALSPACMTITQTALQRAREKGVPISFDVNYRAKLWSAETAGASLAPLIQGVDLLFCKEADARRLFGCSGTSEAVLRQLAATSRASAVIMTAGEDGARVWDGAQVLHEPAVPAVVVDRLGAGDALAAGIIHGWLDGDLATGLRYGVTLAALALAQHGDMVITTPAELESLVSARRARGDNLAR